MSSATAVRVKVICPYCDFEQHAECAELEAHDTLERCLYCGTSFVCAFSVAVSFVVAAIEGRGPGAQARVAQHASRAKAAELAAWKPAKPPDDEMAVLRDETVNRDAMPRVQMGPAGPIEIHILPDIFPTVRIDESASIADNVKRRADAERFLRQELNPALFPSAAPAAEPLTSAPSKEGASSATGAADPLDITSAARDESPGAVLSRNSERDTSAETPRARAEEPPARRVDPRFKMGEKQRAKLCADYRATCPNGGKPPHGWLGQQAERYDVEYKTLYNVLELEGLWPWRSATSDEPLDGSTREVPDSEAPREVAQRLRDLGRDPPAPSDPPGRTFDHTNSHACWCRKGPNNVANRWCSNAPERTQRVTLADPHATMGRPPQRGKPAY